MEKVLKDDPTVYQYDEVYDDMKKKKDEAEAVKKNDKKVCTDLLLTNLQTFKYLTVILSAAKIYGSTD